MLIKEKFDELNEKIEKLETERTKVEEKLRDFEALPENKKLAEMLHAKLCHSNHTDGCGWFYGGWNNMRSSHTAYLEKAERLIKFGDAHQVSPHLLLEMLDEVLK